tara:strand:+ start:1846 stop:4749 length:2904 start_codon:yes stop_codon:yes gene_type:complete
MLLLEGGAGGHSDHPYELDEVKTGEDLKRLFFKIPQYLAVQAAKDMGEREETHGSLKWDGSNNSVKIIDRRGDYEFALDRGSKGGGGKIGNLDVEGVTVDDFDKRGLNRGLRRSTRILITQIMNPALEAHKKEMVEDLKVLGLIDEDGHADTSKFLNLEYIQIDPVTKKANQIEYPHHIIALHGISQFYQNKIKKDIINPETGKPKLNPKTKKKEKEEVVVRPGIPRKKIKDPETGEMKLAKEGTSKSLPMNVKQRKALARIQQRLLPFSRRAEIERDVIDPETGEAKLDPETGEIETTTTQEPFEVYTPSYIYVTREIKKELEGALNSAMGEVIKVFVNEDDEDPGEGIYISQSIDDWLKEIKTIPNYDQSIDIKKLKYDDKTKKEYLSDERHNVSIYHRDLYKYIITNTLPANKLLFENDCPDGETCKLAIYGPVIVEITRILGGVLLDHLKADIRSWRQGKEGKWEDYDVSDLFGSLKDQEGIIVDGLTGKPFKITGQFIVQAAGGQFALKESFTVVLSDDCKITKSINEWLLELENPQNTYIMLDERRVPANSKEIYKLITSGKPVVSFLEKSEYVKPAIAGAIQYHLSEHMRRLPSKPIILDEQPVNGLVDEVMNILLKELSINDDGGYMGNFPPPANSIALFPGAFRPPTKGHLSTAKTLMDQADRTIILISNPQSEKSKRRIDGREITPEMTKEIWELYGIPAEDVQIASAPSPVRALFDFIDDPVLSPPGTKIMLGCSDKGGDEARFQGAASYARKTRGDEIEVVAGTCPTERHVKEYEDLLTSLEKIAYAEIPSVKKEKDPMNIHGSDMRHLAAAALKGNKELEELFKHFFPGDVDHKEVLRILSGENEMPDKDIDPLTEILFRLIENVLDEKKTKVSKAGQKRVSKKIGHMMAAGECDKNPDQCKAIAYSEEEREELEEISAMSAGAVGGSSAGGSHPQLRGKIPGIKIIYKRKQRN